MPKTKVNAAPEVCINFCQYYKPGKKEGLECQGFVVVQRLLRGGRPVSQRRPQRTATPGAQTVDKLKDKVCAACSFREADCDFILTNGSAAPCGGFALLSHLLGCGEIELEDI
jgi:hypothetical protein